MVCTGVIPGNLRSDNGPELLARMVRGWRESAGFRACSIQPGAPWETGHVERFHAQLRAELLDRELSLAMEEGHLSSEERREKYKFKRPHGILGNVPPAVTAKRELTLRPPACAPVHAGQSTQAN